MVLAFAFNSAANALAVSDISLNSHLNQPLDARIMLLSATPEELENLKMQILRNSDEANHLYHWPGVSVSVERNDNGKHFLQITSEKPVTEPIVSFVLELDWSHGQLKREYVLLINPQIG